MGPTFIREMRVVCTKYHNTGSESQPDLGLKSESDQSDYLIEKLNQSYNLTFILAGSVYAIAALLVGIGAILQKRRLRKKSH